MNYVHMFSYNVPAENQYTGRTDFYIHVIATWNGESRYRDDSPMVSVQPVNLSFYECISIKNWSKAHTDIETLASNHFADIAKQERINQARAILAVEENPVLNRYEAAEFDL